MPCLHWYSAAKAGNIFMHMSKLVFMKNYQSGMLLPEHTGIYFLDDDGMFPNNEFLPVVVYEHVFQISNEDAGAEEIETVLQDNHWHNTWRNGIYDYHHYHSNAHEVLACYAGVATVQLGGPSGTTLEFKQGDVWLLPAGTAHKCVQATADFKCIGAYPEGQEFDMNYGKTEERSKASDNIFHVPLPVSDPVFGPNGPLIFHWQKI
jgi:uncharacterized protein YjlB